MKNKETFYIGIDLSLTGTAICVLNNYNKIIKQELINTTSKELIENRILNITNKILSILSEYKDNILIIDIEGLSFNSKFGKPFELAGLHYFLRVQLLLNGYEFKIIPPTELKKYVTGKGNSKKDLMMVCCLKKFEEFFEDNNLCDAYCLARYSGETN